MRARRRATRGGYARWLRSTRGPHLYCTSRPRTSPFFSNSFQRLHPACRLADQATASQTAALAPFFKSNARLVRAHPPRARGAFRTVTERSPQARSRILLAGARGWPTWWAPTPSSPSRLWSTSSASFGRRSNSSPSWRCSKATATSPSTPASYMGGASRVERVRASALPVRRHPLRPAAALRLPLAPPRVRAGPSSWRWRAATTPHAGIRRRPRALHRPTSPQPRHRARPLSPARALVHRARVPTSISFQDRWTRSCVRRASWPPRPMKPPPPRPARVGGSARKVHRLPRRDRPRAFSPPQCLRPCGTLVAIRFFSPLEGFDVLLDALALMGNDAPEYFCWSATGRERDELLGGRLRLGGRVRLLGARPHPGSTRRCSSPRSRSSCRASRLQQRRQRHAHGADRGDGDGGPGGLDPSFEGIGELIGPERGADRGSGRFHPQFAETLAGLLESDPNGAAKWARRRPLHRGASATVRPAVGRLRRLFAEAGAL